MADRRAVLILGAGGFIGGALAARLAGDGERVIGTVRDARALGAGIETRVTGTLNAAADWPALLAGCRAVVHLAGRAHAPAAGDEEWIAAEEATAAVLAGAARRQGVERLVLLSSIAVHGNDSDAGRFRADDPPAPADALGRAKLRIEAAMRHAAGDILVVLRPPRVYGPGVKANFLALLAGGRSRRAAAVRRARQPAQPGVSRQSRRSRAVRAPHERAAGGTFLLRDDAEVSTAALVGLVAEHLARPARLFRCPPGVLRAAARLAGRGDAAERLLGSLSIDDAPTRATLGWQPRVALADGIAATCRWYLARKQR